MKQHKWHKEIKAWADGAVIQTDISEVKEEPIWIDVHSPAWDINDEYRIKPQPKEPQYLYVFKHWNTDEIDITINDERNSNMVKVGQMQYIGKIKLENDE